MATFPFVGFLDGSAYPVIPLGSTTVNVSTSAQLTTALANAAAGQRIVLANGTYSGAFTLTGKTGTSTAGITIEAATTGGAIFASGSTLVVNNCAYVTIKGCSFPYELTSGGNIIAFRGSSNRCRVTRNTLGPASLSTSAGTTKSTFVYMGDDTEHVRVDHNEIRNKSTPGNAVLGDGNFTTFQVVRHMRWDHNVVRGIGPEAANEKEPFRLGVSSMSKSMSYSVVERNHFVDCVAEPEIVSIKAGGVRVSGNTVLRCIGGLVLRHGTDCQMTDNYVVDRAQTFGSSIGSGGIRFYDKNHEVSYNYVEGVYGGAFQNALMLDSGDAEGSSTNLSAHWRVVNALLERNVLVGNPTGIVIGNNYSLAPSDSVVRDNLVAQVTTPPGVAVNQLIAPVSSTITNNSYGSTPAELGLAQGSDTIWRRAGFGPRLSFLQAGDVGVAGDPSDADGTGVLVSGGGTASPSGPVAPVGQTTKFTESFELGNFSRWNSVQTHTYDGSPSGYSPNYSLQIVNAGSDHPSALRTEVRDGDTAVGSHERAELSGFGKTPILNGDEQWYEFDVKFGESSFPTVSQWLIFFQWHQVNDDGAPALALSVHDDGKVYFEREPDGEIEFIPCFTVRPGVWEHLTVHVKWSPNASTGFVQLHLNGVEVVAKKFCKTMYTTDNVDPYYVKMGQYRRSSNTATTVVLHDNLRISTLPQVTPTPTPDPTPTTDQATAAGVFGWGTPLAISDEFGYSGSPLSTKWSSYNGAGHDGNGRRVPARVTVDGAKLVGTGLANGDSFGMAHRFDQQYGRWEVRMRAFQNATSNGNDYHPVLIIWPQSERWPEDGEYDFVELSVPGQQSLTAFMHFPHDASAAVQQREFTKTGVDTSVFHNYALEWTPTALVGYVDGVEWFRTSGGASSIRRDIQTMPSGHLTIQLDNFDGTSQTPATMEVEWVRVYSLTPSGPVAGPQSLTGVGIPSSEAHGRGVVTGASPAPPAGSRPTLLGVDTVLGPATLGFTTATGPLPAGQLLFGTGIGSGQAFGTGVVSVADGPLDIAGVGIPSSESFGRGVATIGQAPPPAPGRVLVPSLWAVGRDGTTLTPLPAWTKISLSPVRNSPGSLTVEYPAGAPGFSVLDDNVSAYPLRRLEVRIWLGGNATGAVGGWLVQKSGDDLEPGSRWSFSGHFHEWLLTQALVAPQQGATSQALEFAGASAGLIFRTVLEQAQARGALPLITRDFTDTHDSNGRAWAKRVSSLAFPPKTTVAQVADKCVELDLCEYEVTAGRIWRAFNPGSRGTDRTVGASPLMFRHAVNLREHSRRENAKDGGTAVLAAGSEGFYEWAESATAKANLGWRAEVGVDAGQVKSQAGVQAVAATQLEILANGTAEYTSGIDFAVGEPLPLIDYGIGDWAYAWVGNKRKRLRISQLGLEFGVGQAPKGTVAQNDLITDRVAALYRRLNAISSGDAVVGESVPTTGGPGEDTNPPAAPTGVTVSSTIAYQVTGETLTLALVDVGWAPVTTNAYPDNATASKAKAASLIAARMRSGQQIAEDWTWAGVPAVVGDNNDALIAEWQVDPASSGGGGDPTPWLEAYAASRATGGAITNDVASYRVQYLYLGAQQVTTPGPRGEEPPDQLQPDGAWQEPVGSPTSSTSLRFGNVEGGRAIGVRVAAVDTVGNQGPWSVTVAADTAVDDRPPPAPSKPLAVAWFETMNVTWDGRGSAGEDMLAAAPDFASGGKIEVHVAQGIDFIPDRPVGADGRTVDLGASTTYRTYFEAAGTTNIADLPVESGTWFVRFVAVDRNGNASPPSETSDGVLPEQLVNIQIGPDAISRVQIIDGEIVNAKIADLAVNNAKISDISVGKLTAGTMTAQVTVSGRFQTPVINGNQVVFDNAGIRLIQGNTVVGRWQVSDASMLVTGTYLSGLSGKRINILPSGTMIFYPPAGTNYGFIENLDGDLRMSGQVNQDGRAGYILIDETRAAMTYSQITSYNNPRTRFQVDPVAAASWAPIISNRIDRRIDVGPLGPRWLYTNFDNSGDIGTSIVHLQQVAAASNHAMLYGANSDAGLVLDAGFIGVVHNNVSPAPIHAASFDVVSGSAAKTAIRKLEAPDGFLGMVCGAEAKTWRYRAEQDRRPSKPGGKLRRRREQDGRPVLDGRGREVFDEVDADWTHPQRQAPQRFGPLADDLPEVLQRRHPRTNELMVSLGDMVGVLWGAVGELAARVDELTDKPGPGAGRAKKEPSSE